eukprot:SAG31_NODE_2725_length_5186_cov_4.147435_6_plen_179_part_00
MISPFAASGNDGGVTANLKLVLGSRDGEGLERSLANGAESMRDVAVRSALTALLQSGSAAARLDARTYLNLVHLLEAAMKLVLEQNDLDNAIVLLDMINVYYRLEKSGKNHFLSQEEVLRRSPLWQSLRFWKVRLSRPAESAMAPFDRRSRCRRRPRSSKPRRRNAPSWVARRRAGRK